MILCLLLGVKRNSKLFRALLHFLILTAAAAPACAQVYKWVDERGVTHYGERPPQGGKASEVPNRLGSPALSSPQAPPRASAPANTPAAPPDQEERTDETRRVDPCDTQKELLARLIQNRQADARLQGQTNDAVSRQEKLVAELCKGR
jgi:Domain of unknown function (DUF4124)